METPSQAIAHLQQALETTANESSVQKTIQDTLAQLRIEYRQSPASFSSREIEYLKKLSGLSDSIHEFLHAQENAADVRTRDEAVEVIYELEALRERLWPPLLVRRLDKEIRELTQKSSTLPESKALRRDANRKRILVQLETDPPKCRCGARMVLRETLSSAFWGCSTFPSCFFRRWLTKDQEELLGVA